MKKTSILHYDDYRDLIRDLAKSKKISFRSVCSATNIHTSYFSRVMSKDANLSEEQLYRVADFLHLRDWQLEYFLLLGAQERSGFSGHQQYLGQKIASLREKYSKLVTKLDDVYSEFSDRDISRYYQNALTARVHMLLTIEQFRTDLIQLRQRLKISQDKLNRQLSKLEELGIIEKSEDGAIVLLKHAVHLDENHPASKGNHKNWRIDTLAHLSLDEGHPSDYHLSAVFSCDESTKLKIKELLKEAIVQAQSLVNQCEKIDDVYHIGLDVY